MRLKTINDARKRGPMPSDDLIDKLIAGNRRFSTNNLLHSNQDTGRRMNLANNQKPLAAFVCCSDSRVPPEIIFDCGLGDLFTTRVAGNITTDEIWGNLEYLANTWELNSLWYSGTNDAELFRPLLMEEMFMGILGV